MMTSVKANYSRTRKTLPQGRKQRFLPAFRVDLPAHFRFAPLVQHRCPDCLITLVACDVEAIHNRHASREITMRLHIHIVLAPLGSDTRVEGNTHGHWIWQRNTVFPGMDFVSFERTAIALDSKQDNLGFESMDVVNNAVEEYIVSTVRLTI